MIPSATKRSRRAARMLRAIPRLRWKSAKRVVRPKMASRMISRLQRSPTSSSARAAEQFWPSYVLPSITASGDGGCMMLPPSLEWFQWERQRVRTVDDQAEAAGQGPMSEATLVAEASIPAPGRNLCGLAWDGSHLWHADAGTSLLYCLDPQSGTVMRTLEVRDVRTCTDYAGGMLWQIAGRPKTLCELDPELGAVRRAIPLRSETICGLQLVGDHFWTTEEEGTLLWCRLEDAAVERELQAVPRIAGGG